MEAHRRRLEHHALTSKRFRAMLYASSIEEDRHVRKLAEKGDQSALAIQSETKKMDRYFRIMKMSIGGDALATVLYDRRKAAHQERVEMEQNYAYRGETLTQYLKRAP